MYLKIFNIYILCDNKTREVLDFRGASTEEKCFDFNKVIEFS